MGPITRAGNEISDSSERLQYDLGTPFDIAYTVDLDASRVAWLFHTQLLKWMFGTVAEGALIQYERRGE